MRGLGHFTENATLGALEIHLDQPAYSTEVVFQLSVGQMKLELPADKQWAGGGDVLTQSVWAYRYGFHPIVPRDRQLAAVVRSNHGYPVGKHTVGRHQHPARQPRQPPGIPPVGIQRN